jgi:hypothetical protein
MAYLARDLVTNSYYTSGVIAVFQTITGDQLAEGLNLLNEFLAVKSITIDLIPYYTETIVDAVVGQEVYFIPNLLSIDTVTFDLDTGIRMPMTRRTRDQYFGEARVNQVNSLPMTWRAERVVGGMNLYVYFQADQAYPFKVWGKFALTQVTSENMDLSTVYDLFYIAYMRLGLAEMICEYYGITLQPQTSQKLKDYEQQFKSVSAKDPSMRKLTAFNKSGSGFGWWDVFIGHGYSPQ